MILCDHGCGKEGLFYSKNTKRWRCSSHANLCITKAAKTGKAIKVAFDLVDEETGLTNNEKRLAKIRETRKTKIDKESGLPLDIARAYKAHITKNIIQEDGTTIQQKAAIKISNTKTNDPKSSLAAIAGAITKKNKIDENSGLSIHELAIQRRLVTMDEIQENGLTLFENSQKKSRFRGFKMERFKNTDLYYQGKNELIFLESQYLIYGETIHSHIKRGLSIQYFDVTRGVFRLYYPDFIIDNKLYEIKSGWTWNNNKENSDIQNRNISKLNAAKLLFNEVHLILDKIDILW